VADPLWFWIPAINTNYIYSQVEILSYQTEEESFGEPYTVLGNSAT
jgi:hypothetical protein